MQYLVPNYYKEFQCIGNKCSNHCCHGWRVLIDPSSHKKYVNAEGAFGEKLRENIIEKNGEYFFKMTDKNQCPFLNKENLCDIYIELGRESLCHTCTTYPRLYNQYADIMESNLCISCPEAARLLLSQKEPLSFLLAEDDFDFRTDVDTELFNNLTLARSISIDIMQLRPLPLWKRAILIVLLASQIQELLDNGLKDFSSILYDYTTISGLEAKISPYAFMEKVQESKGILTEYFISIVKQVFQSNELTFYTKLYEKYLGKAGNGQYSFLELEKEFNQYYKDQFYQYENFFVYFLFKNYMKTLSVKNLYKTVIVMVFNFYIVKVLDILVWLENGKKLDLSDQINIMSCFSRDFEHAQTKYQLLYDILGEHNFDSVTSLAFLLYTPE
ncbi:MAG: hypothetical protein HFG43_08640 [Lachnospiraceae bacterium]|nr:hypothetical protein [Lachnospiraceae bacterium]